MDMVATAPAQHRGAVSQTGPVIVLNSHRPLQQQACH